MNEPLKQQVGLQSIFSKIDAEEQADSPDFRPPSARGLAYADVTGSPQQQEDEYDRIGALMTVLFPDGLRLDGEEDFAAFYLQARIVEHVSRFAQRGMKDRQSIHGVSTYSAILENRILRNR